MPKKQPRNAFYFFMLDYREDLQARGEHFPGGLKDVAEVAGPVWANLGKGARKKYEDLAKEEKIKKKGEASGNNLTNQLRTFEEVDRSHQEEDYQRQRMEQDIKTMVESLKTVPLLRDYKFYLIHCNYFCVTEGDCYHPAEIALSEFCLGEGVTNTFHTIIQPPEIPLGYRFDAQQKSDSTHRIPLEDNGGQTYFYKILQDINKFLEPGRRANGGDYPPMFTMTDNVMLNHSLTAVKSVITNLCYSDTDYSHYSVTDKYRVYPLDKLFYQLKLACTAFSDSQVTVNLSLARNELERDVFNFTQSIACDFHKDQDAVEYCSLSFVQRWVFLICDECCQFIDIDLVPGKHVPINTDVEHNHNKRLEKEEAPPQPKTFTWNDSSKDHQAWVPRELPPLRKPTRTANLNALLPKAVMEQGNAPYDKSEENFPAISMVPGRGRGRNLPQGGGRGSISFAQAMKRN